MIIIKDIHFVGYRDVSVKQETVKKDAFKRV